MKKIKIVVCGALGRMGSKVMQEIAKSQDIELSGAVDVIRMGDSPQLKGDSPHGDSPHSGTVPIKTPEFFSEFIKKSDIAIDFTTPFASLKFTKECAVFKKPIVIGTTGFNDLQIRQIKKLSKQIPILISPNMSPAVNLTFILSEIIAKKLPNFDIHIMESHHKMKKDAPSGTAIKYLKHISSVSNRPINITSIRAGDIIGEHTILYAGPHERIELIHRAHSREVFVLGTICAAKWLIGKKPGIYDYMDVLDLKNIYK